MIFIKDTTDIRLEEPSVVMIGKFDGFHRGHQRLIQEALRVREPGERVVLLSFSVSPQSFISGGDDETILSEQDKLRRAEELGIDVLIEYPFTDSVRRMEASDFIADILIDRLHMVKIIAGADCRFGYMGRGNADLLREEASARGFKAFIIGKISYKGEDISSSRIREALRQGDTEDAMEMMSSGSGQD